jgi:hypothetical protein
MYRKIILNVCFGLAYLSTFSNLIYYFMLHNRIGVDICILMVLALVNFSQISELKTLNEKNCCKCKQQ